ncbi:MAG: hypothetical protein PHG97_04595 [Candidatus Margulisbacteria bacterium]|nr:hypothetical protein [Candidatus Margulisiibacteriota bacterium]
MKKIVIYHLIAWFLVTLMGTHSALYALAFDKEKLMALDPLCTERIAHQARDFQNKRFWGNLGLGLALLGVIWNNSGGLSDDAKLGNLTQGLTLITTGAILYYTSGDPVVQNDTLQQLDLTGVEKEEVAYSILKYNAARSKVVRINSGMILMATGLGYALLTSLATKASQSYKDVQYISAAVFFTQGLLAYLYPGQNEKDMDKIDDEVGAPSN